MIPRRELVRIVASCLAAVAAGVGIRGASADEPIAGKAPSVASAPGADFRLEVSPSGTLSVTHKGMPILSSGLLSWAANWAWTGSEQKLVPSGDGESRVVGGTDGLGLKWIGDLTTPAPNVVQIDLRIRAERSIPNLIGMCWEWQLKLDSPSFGGKRSDPELIPDNGGWRWRAAGGPPIALELQGAARVQFEANQKHTIRTYLVADRVEKGIHQVRMTLRLPEGARRVPSPSERYDAVKPASCFREALGPGEAPVDLSFLNRDDRPAGRRGFVRADGDRLVFADGTPARFWGGNLAATPLFSTPPGVAENQARRMARLGYNLMRIHHHDSDWVDPNVFGSKSPTTRRLDPKALDRLDWWIKCLEDQGIYVWLDLHVGRTVKPGDGLNAGADEIARQGGSFNGLCYYNDRLQGLMREFQAAYLNHLNRHTNRRYKDDPGIIAILISNENDTTSHGCFAVLPDKNNPYHNAQWTRRYKAFAEKYGLPPDRVFQTWLPGPSKLFLAQAEHEFNEPMVANLRRIGVQAPIVTTNYWGGESLFALPPLTDGDLIDVHSYGQSEELGKNPHYQGNFVDWIAAGQVDGKPMTITEWNVEYPNADRFTAPLYVASLAALQGWDAPMIYNYSQSAFVPDPGPDKWSTYHDPSLTALMPAAALLYRRGHVAPARKAYCLLPDAKTFFDRALTPDSSAAIRTLAEQSKLTIGMPEVRELPWLKPTKPADGTTVVTDPDRDFLPEGQTFIRSDTGELTRDWELGIQTIDTPRTQAVGGWVGGRRLATKDATFEVATKKAVVALTSVDDQPLPESRFILVTAVARTIPSPGDRAPYLSEPVRCQVTLRNRNDGLELLALGRDGLVTARPALERRGDAVSFRLPIRGGTHWYVLRAPARPAAPTAPTGGDPSARVGR